MWIHTIFGDFREQCKMKKARDDKRKSRRSANIWEAMTAGPLQSCMRTWTVKIFPGSNWMRRSGSCWAASACQVLP